MTKLQLELTTQEAAELEMLLESVKIHHAFYKTVEVDNYTEAIAAVHQRIRACLDNRAEQQVKKLREGDIAPNEIGESDRSQGFGIRRTAIAGYNPDGTPEFIDVTTPWN